jgi:polysaccharide pyruvyl transferase WcaK-like protein
MEIEIPAARPAVRVLPRLGLFGCPLDTGNNGVSALGLSMIAGLRGACESLNLSMFDYGKGSRDISIAVGSKREEVRFVGCYASRRYYQAHNLAQLHAAATMHLAGVHPMLRKLRKLDAILDISGGDSFSDIYGRRRFNSVVAPKLLALKLEMPLILPPQTYGPYTEGAVRRTAQRVLRGAVQVWARDRRSLGVVEESLGTDFDPARHRQGIDVAFGLPARQPDPAVQEAIEKFRAGADVLIGLNVSGLLYTHPGEDIERYGFRSSYRDLIHDLLERIMQDVQGARVLLIPHVAPRRPSNDCDATANRALMERLSPAQRERVFVIPAPVGPMECKWIIGQCDWFCGTRMHACIAALSQGVPAVGVAYSDKTRGVFDTVGAGGSVVDPRIDECGEMVARIVREIEQHDMRRRELEAQMPGVQVRLSEQFEAMLSPVRSANHPCD